VSPWRPGISRDKDKIMGRRPARITEADIKRVIQAVRATGGHVSIEILPDGTIRIREIEKCDKQGYASKRKIEL